MKKFGKFLFGTITLASIAAGAYYVYKNYIKKDSSDDFEDFEEDFEDFDTEEEETEETRGYVPINLSSEDDKAPETAEVAPEEDAGEEEDLH
ncbi:MAG: hypothetical protein K0R46_3154 [Herbinix sp.]|jgi:hypothetical protein|nr:hypothetical protein [Herbinix sp.]